MRRDTMTMLPCDGPCVTRPRASSPPATGLEKLLRGLSVFTMLITVPQVLTIWIEHNAGGGFRISLVSYLIAAVLWLLYALQEREKTIYLRFGGWVLVDLAVLIVVVVYH